MTNRNINNIITGVKNILSGSEIMLKPVINANIKYTVIHKLLPYTKKLDYIYKNVDSSLTINECADLLMTSFPEVNISLSKYLSAVSVAKLVINANSSLYGGVYAYADMLMPSLIEGLTQRDITKKFKVSSKTLTKARRVIEKHISDNT